MPDISDLGVLSTLAQIYQWKCKKSRMHSKYLCITSLHDAHSEFEDRRHPACGLLINAMIALEEGGAVGLGYELFRPLSAQKRIPRR